MRSKVSDFFKRTIRYCTEHPWWKTVLEWSKTHSFPGLKRIPLYNLVVFIQQELKNDALTTRANSMAYSFFQSIFPTIIVLFTVLAYTPLYAYFERDLSNSIQEIMPGDTGQMVFEFIEDVVTRPRGGLLSFGFFLAIWFASNGMLSMMHGLEKDHHTAFKRRTMVEKRLMAIQLTFLLSLVFVASVVVGIMGDLIIDKIFYYVHVDFISRITLIAFRWVVLLLLVYTTFSMIYLYGAPVHKRLSFINPGAVVGSGFSLLTSAGFSFYVDNFGNYNKLYGSIGTLIVLMIWIQLNCMILLMGFEINAGIVVLREQHKTGRTDVNGV